MLLVGHWNCKNLNLPKARVILHCIVVWCWGIPCLMVCNVFTATCFQQKPVYCSHHRFDLVMIRPPESTMEPSLSRLILSGMLGSCSFSQPWTTDTGSKSFECTLVSTMKTHTISDPLLSDQMTTFI